MNTLTKTIKRTYRQVRGLFPSRLPIGLPEFETWVDNLADTYPLPTKDRASLVFTLSTAIMHLKHTEAYKSNIYFYLLLNAAAAKQVAGAAFHEIKAAQIAAQKAAQLAAVEVTTPLQVVTNGPQV